MLYRVRSSFAITHDQHSRLLLCSFWMHKTLDQTIIACWCVFLPSHLAPQILVLTHLYYCHILTYSMMILLLSLLTLNKPPPPNRAEFLQLECIFVLVKILRVWNRVCNCGSSLVIFSSISQLNIHLTALFLIHTGCWCCIVHLLHVWLCIAWPKFEQEIDRKESKGGNVLFDYNPDFIYWYFNKF